MQLPRRWTGQVLAWAGLVGTSVVLAMLTTAAVAGGIAGRAQATPAPASPATAALADGDDVRTQFLATERPD